MIQLKHVYMNYEQYMNDNKIKKIQYNYRFEFRHSWWSVGGSIWRVERLWGGNALLFGSCDKPLSQTSNLLHELPLLAVQMCPASVQGDWQVEEEWEDCRFIHENPFECSVNCSRCWPCWLTVGGSALCRGVAVQARHGVAFRLLQCEWFGGGHADICGVKTRSRISWKHVIENVLQVCAPACY